LEDKSYCKGLKASCEDFFETCNVDVVLPSHEEIAVALPEKSPATDILKKLASILEVGQRRLSLYEEGNKNELKVGDVTAKEFAEEHSKVVVKLKPALLFSRITPQYLLLNRKACFDSLLELLKVKDTENLDKVWKWIKELPYYNEVILGELQNLKTTEEVRQKYFETKDTARALYAIYVLIKIVIPNDAENDECKKNFIQKGGYNLAETIFLDTLKIRERTNLVVKLLLHSLYLMNSLLNKNNVNALVDKPEKMWNSVLGLLKWCFVESENCESIARPLTETESAQLTSNCICFHTLLATGHSDKLSLQVVSKEYMELLKNGIMVIQ
jgi:hypothetical protein